MHTDPNQTLESLANELAGLDKTLTQVGLMLTELQERKTEIERLIRELSSGGGMTNGREIQARL